jgi:hypothetical protein
VYVECNKYTGHGIVKYDEDTPPEMVDVMLENGNIWRYPLEKVKPENNSTRWPRWIQELKFLKHNVVTRQIIIW